MIFRLYYEQRGAHVHCRLFAGTHDGALGKCGEFVMRREEFLEFIGRGSRLFDLRSDGTPIPLPERLPREPEITARLCLEPVLHRSSAREIGDATGRIVHAIGDAFDLGFKAAGGEVTPLWPFKGESS